MLQLLSKCMGDMVRNCVAQGGDPKASCSVPVARGSVPWPLVSLKLCDCEEKGK